MSQKEIKRIELLEKLSAKVITQKEAAEILDLAPRHLRRLQTAYKTAYKKEGAKALISKRRGSPSNNQLSKELKKTAIALVLKRVVPSVVYWYLWMMQQVKL